VLGPLQRVLQPAIWFVNLFARPLLRLFGVRPGEASEAPRLSPEEIRTLVRESSAFMPKKHVTILLNLFDLTDITVQDIMLPRSKIESIRLDEDMQAITRHLATSYHMRLPVFRDARGDVVGVLHLRKVLAPLMAGTLDKAQIEALLAEPYFVPATTPVFTQMQYFQENEERIALVVDEYGELMGLVTLEDIIEEIIGKFTTSVPTAQGGKARTRTARSCAARSVPAARPWSTPACGARASWSTRSASGAPPAGARSSKRTSPSSRASWRR
jgi:Mg2+/Co2+ transporter CorB